MQAWKIITHSVRQVFGNLGPAIRLSAVLYVIQWAVIIGLDRLFGDSLTGAGAGDAAELAALKALFGPALLSVAVLLLADIWIAVAWHRYVLLAGEDPGLVPAFKGRRMLAYFGAMVVMVLVFGLLLTTLSLLVTLAGSLLGNGVATYLVPALFLVIAGGLMLRVSTVLPGFALEPGHRLTEGWEATRGETLDFFLLALIVGMTANALQNLTLVLLSGAPLLLAAVTFVLQWMLTMIGVSILTTLYGHYIQKRPLI